MVRMLTILVLLTLGGCTSMPHSSDIVGSWQCGPYEVEEADFTVSAIDRPIYFSDGKFTELGTSTHSFPDGTKIHVEMRLVGNWALVGDLIEIQFTSAEFLSSDNPLFTIEKGQAFLDAQMQRNNWSKKRVITYGERLVTAPVDGLYKQAKVQVSCSKA